MVVTSGAASGGEGIERGDSGCRLSSRLLLVGHIVYNIIKRGYCRLTRLASLIDATTNGDEGHSFSYGPRVKSSAPGVPCCCWRAPISPAILCAGVSFCAV
ncbi:hypothetical protein NDU88_002967 [Pleurodeles waltl]|uniref:Uncharacterized protein n=1 Tax=Pleurodeles waltl TaxID=8319 RepID=A0AAV7KX35_PLEWA|nr:hypothetical protein NDU88_002967 [Pleurodeles waltl]